MAGLGTWLAKAAGAMLPTRVTPGSHVDWSTWREPSRPHTDPAALIQDGYVGNSAVFACVQVLVRAFVEPELRVYEPDGTAVVDHPMITLLRRPNPLMSAGELWGYLMAYTALGGNGYLYKLRGASGPPRELWPYNAAQLWPVAGPVSWIDHYAYDLGEGRVQALPPADILHWKWAVDPRTPWVGLAPLVPVVREVATDSELTRYLQALLTNDAVPRGLIKLPPGPGLRPDEEARMKADWGLRFGGSRRGGLGILYNGASYERVALNLQELAFDALRGVPEARIAAALGVPAIVAGLNIGLARSTYSNYEEARKSFTEQTLVPLWAALADEITADLLPEFDPKPGRYAAFDLSRVVALREGADKQYARMVQAWQAGVVTLNETRAALGFAPLDTPAGDAFAPPRAAMAELGPVAPPKARRVKTLPAPAESIETRMQRTVAAHLAATYQAVAAHVEAP